MSTSQNPVATGLRKPSEESHADPLPGPADAGRESDDDAEGADWPGPIEEEPPLFAGTRLAHRRP